MPRDILSEYGSETPMDQKPRATGGGPTTARDVMNYKPPTGPRNILDPKNPGLHGTNYGNCGTQGPYGGPSGESGRSGLGGDNSGMGTNRK
jgi:hypothetical protein